MQANYADVWAAVARAVPGRRAAVTVGGPTLSYAELDEHAARLAGTLVEHGLGAGDRLAIFLYNRAEYLVALFAAMRIGVVPVPLNFRYREAEVQALLEDSGAAALLYPGSLAPVVAGLGSRPPVLIQIDDDGSAPIPGALDYAAALAAAPVPAAPAPADGRLMLYTGGTTGRPKAVVWGLEELFEVQLYSTYGALGIPEPQSIDEAVRVAADPETPLPVVLPLAPLMHGTALFSTMNALLLGGSAVIMSSPRLDAEGAARAIVEHAVTRLIVAGDAVAIPLLEAAAAVGIERFPSLRDIMSSGMRFSDTTKARLHGVGDLAIIDLLASTEGGPFAMAVTRGAADLPARLKLTPDAVVLDERYACVRDQPGAVGILAYRGALPRGYFNDPEKTAANFPMIDGRRHVAPGDWVRVLADGYIELLGRGSSVVNTGGEKIYPAEVEDVLLRHPGVEDAVVFGMPDPRWGEALTAVVALGAGATATEAELREHVGAELAGYKKPRRIHLRATLDRGPTGKVDMTRLKASLRDEPA